MEHAPEDKSHLLNRSATPRKRAAGYDRSVDAMYLSISGGPVARTLPPETVTVEMTVDLDGNGLVCGVEVLGLYRQADGLAASERLRRREESLGDGAR